MRAVKRCIKIREFQNAWKVVILIVCRQDYLKHCRRVFASDRPRYALVTFFIKGYLT